MQSIEQEFLLGRWQSNFQSVPCTCFHIVSFPKRLITSVQCCGNRRRFLHSLRKVGLWIMLYNLVIQWLFVLCQLIHCLWQVRTKNKTVVLQILCVFSVPFKVWHCGTTKLIAKSITACVRAHLGPALGRHADRRRNRLVLFCFYLFKFHTFVFCHCVHHRRVNSPLANTHARTALKLLDINGLDWKFDYYFIVVLYDQSTSRMTQDRCLRTPHVVLFYVFLVFGSFITIILVEGGFETTGFDSGGRSTTFSIRRLAVLRHRFCCNFHSSLLIRQGTRTRQFRVVYTRTWVHHMLTYVQKIIFGGFHTWNFLVTPCPHMGYFLCSCSNLSCVLIFLDTYA